MKEFKFKGLLINNRWHKNVSIKINNNGIIQSIKESKDSFGFTDFAIPGFQNAHSHAFQYAMAGLGELHDTKPNQNDFWSWRNAMYDLALSINPDQLEAIATMLYSVWAEMLHRLCSAGNTAKHFAAYLLVTNSLSWPLHRSLSLDMQLSTDIPSNLKYNGGRIVGKHLLVRNQYFILLPQWPTFAGPSPSPCILPLSPLLPLDTKTLPLPGP